MYLNMYRAGRLNNPGRRGIARNDRSRERRQPWRIRQASSGAGRDDGEKEKNSLPVALSIDATGTMPQHHLLLIIHHARSERQEPVARWPNTPRHEAAAGRRPAKERGGRRQKAGAAWSTARTRCWPGHHPPPAVRHQAIITTAAQRPPGRLRTRISSPPFEDFGESS